MLTRAIAPLLLALSCAVVAFTLAGPILSGDLWWHLSAGHWMLDQRALPATDPFSHTAGDEPWILQEYGSQALFAWVDGSAGFTGLRVLGAALGVLLLLAVYLRARAAVAAPWAAALTALFAALFALKWELRPHLLSAFFVLAFERLVFPRRRDGPACDPGPAKLALAALLACLWVQLHAEALFAPIFALAALGAALVAWATGIGYAEGEPARWRRPLRLALLFAASLGGTLLSPLGSQPHAYALFRRSVPQQYIEEWFPGFVLPGDPRFLPFTQALFALVVAAGLVALLLGLHQAARLLRRRPDLPLERLAFLLVCLVFAVEARRFLWLLWFPCFEAVALVLARRPQLANARLVPLSLGVLALATLGTTHYPQGAWRTLQAGRFAADTDRTLFPVEAARRLEECAFRGNLYHPYEWGGFLGYRLWPRAKVFLDARTVLFEEVIPERWLAERDPEYAREVFTERDVRAIVFKRLVERDGRLVAWRPPDADEAWIRAWADELAELWLRADDDPRLAALEQVYAAVGVPFDRDEGFVELAALVARPEWQRERGLLPGAAFGQLDAALLERANAGELDGEGWLALAGQALGARLGRSARYAIRRAFEVEGRDHAAFAHAAEGLSAAEQLRAAREALR